jgi:hypothetical protein
MNEPALASLVGDRRSEGGQKTVYLDAPVE